MAEHPQQFPTPLDHVVGKDSDVGVSLLRMDENQPWPLQPGNPIYDPLLAQVLEWGIAIYDLELTE